MNRLPSLAVRFTEVVFSPMVRRRAALLAGLALLTVGATPAAAAAPAPQITLHAAAMPTRIAPPTDAVQELIVAAEGGSFTVAPFGQKFADEARGDLLAGSSTVSNVVSFNGRFGVGEPISGQGIPAGTTIVAASSKELTLSQPATTSGVAVALIAGLPVLPFDATAAEVAEALEVLSAIGEGNVTVTGPAGGPYTITMVGDHANSVLGDHGLEPLSADASGLTGPSASAALTILNPGSTGEAHIALFGANVGAVPTDGTKITVTDLLPEGLTFLSGEGEIYSMGEEVGGPQCTHPSQREVSCAISSGSLAGNGDGVFSIALNLKYEGAAAETTLQNEAEVSGGGISTTPPITQSISVTHQPTPAAIASLLFSATDVAGAASTQAASHPNVLLSGFDTSSQMVPAHAPQVTAVDLPKDVVVDLPIGFLGNPLAAAACPQYQVIRANGEECPPGSTIGVVNLSENRAGYRSTNGFTAISYLHNTIPDGGFPAEFGLGKNNIPGPIYGQVVHTAVGYVLRVVAPGIPRAAEIRSVLLAMFGDPNARNGLEPHIPFFTMPADCSAAGLKASYHIDFWHNPAPLPVNPDGSLDFEAANFSGPQWSNGDVAFPTPSGCNKLHFEPSLQARPSTNLADSPSGLNVDLKVPQPEEVEGLSTPPLKDAVVTLPKGLVVNPSSAAGQQGCSAAQIATETTKPGNCPDPSKIGEVELRTPLLANPLPGAIYLGTPECAPCTNADAQSGKLIRLYLEINDPPTGVVIKMPGSANLDPATGQLKTVFQNNPQLPFSELKVSLKQGNRAPLTTPPTCGGYETTSSLTPWSAPESGPPAAPADHYAIAAGPNGQACASTEAALPNKPSFSAGTTSTQAGAYAPFVLKLSREDGSARLTHLNVTLPPGLSGKLAGVGECSAAAIKAAEATSGMQQKLSPSCPLSSELGTVDVAAGSGPTPLHTAGHAYLAGPYKGAPLSMAIITPAVAGPFDLGTVVVRSALYVNPETTQITVKSDPIPTVLAGIPLDVRSIAVDISRNQFTLNPTNCEKMTIGAQALSTLGQSAALSNPFQVGGCKGLGFAPKLALKLKGATKRNRNPSLHATLTYPSKGAYANIARASVALPHSEFLDQAHIKTICTRVQFAEGNVPGEKCPPASIYGFARATTPLLDKPVEGPVYLRSSSNNLPDLVAALNGQINVVLDGRIDTDKQNGIRNSFEVVPDAPVSKFTLEMQGGKKGLLVNSEDICRKPQRATVRFTAQNGKVDNYSPLIANSCKGKAHKKHSSK